MLCHFKSINIDLGYNKLAKSLQAASIAWKNFSRWLFKINLWEYGFGIGFGYESGVILICFISELMSKIENLKAFEGIGLLMKGEKKQ